MNTNVLNVVPEAVGAWLALPSTVAGPSPADKSKMQDFRLATGDVVKMANASRRQLVFELWSAVLGLPPPVPGGWHRNKTVIGPLSGLKDAHALFRGIERALAEDDDGSDVLAYVIKPEWMYEYDASSMVSVALKVGVPQDVVFVVYVRIDNPDVAPAEMTGVVTHWGFVEADKNDLTLPAEYNSRYRTRMW